VQVGECRQGGSGVQFGQQFEPLRRDGGNPVLQVLQMIGVVEIPGADGVDEVMHQRVGPHAEPVHQGGGPLQRGGGTGGLLQERPAQFR